MAKRLTTTKIIKILIEEIFDQIKEGKYIKHYYNWM
jgi:hypothetical protein